MNDKAIAASLLSQAQTRALDPSAPASYVVAGACEHASQADMREHQFMRAARIFDTALSFTRPAQGRLVVGWNRGAHGVEATSLTLAGATIHAILLGSFHNHLTLARELGVDKSLSDAELLLHAWSRWEASCVEELLGDFAFCILDERDTGFAAVSPSLDRCLFYDRDKKRPFFATHPALLLDDSRSIACDLRYFVGNFGSFTGNRTPFESIGMVRSGYAVHFQRGRCRDYRWWVPPVPGTVRYRSAEDYSQNLRYLLAEAVLSRVESHSHCAVSLSAGIDSGAVAVCLADLQKQKRLNTQVSCISYSSDTPHADESQYARQVAREIGFEHYAVRARQHGLADLAQIACRLGAPDSHLFLGLHHVSVAAKARELGATIVLNGVGGEAFLGEAGFVLNAFKSPRMGSLWEALKVLRAVGVRRAALDHMRHARFRNRGIGVLPNWLCPSLLETLPPVETTTVHPSHRVFDELQFQCMGAGSILHHCFWHTEGVSLISPHMDVRVLEFAFGLPEEQRMASDELGSKALLRKTFPEVRRELSVLGARATLDEDLGYRWASGEHLSYLMLRIENLPQNLRGSIDMAKLRTHMFSPYNEANLELFTLYSWALWAEGLRDFGFTLV